MVVYQSEGTPGGRDPDRTTHSASVDVSRMISSTAVSSAVVSAAPGWLILVVVPSGSVMVRLVLAGVEIGTAMCGILSLARPVTSRSLVPAGTTAQVSTPAPPRTREMLTPLPAETSVELPSRFTWPRCSGPGRDAVRSMLGLRVTVTITGGLLRRFSQRSLRYERPFNVGMCDTLKHKSWKSNNKTLKRTFGDAGRRDASG